MADNNRIIKPRSGTYRSWTSMWTRCTNPKAKEWLYYGGRGIKVCERWKQFKNFLADMGERPPHYTIERKDSNGDYIPSNCEWVTRKQQARNTSRNVFLSFNGETKTVAEWAETIGLKNGTLHFRLVKGWSVEKALTTRLMTRKEASSIGGRNAQALRSSLSKPTGTQKP